MPVEIRAARAEEMEEFKRIIGDTLAMPGELFQALRPEWTLCAFENGKLATTYGAWPFTMCFNGEDVPVAGVTSVGTLPIYRRRGHLRKIIATHFELLHQQGERPIAILFASLAAIYQRFGYAVVSTHNAYAVEPRFLEFSHQQAVAGSLREATGDEFALFVDLYRKFRAGRTGYVHRGRAMWQAGVLAPPHAGCQLHIVVYQEAAEALGYVVYTIEPPHTPLPVPEQRLEVRDLMWLTPAAYRAVWDYFARMDLVAEIVWKRVPPDDPLPHLLVEPRMLHLTSRDGLLGRIVDVERALPRRCYGAEGLLTFELLDDMCPWNRGRWQLETCGAEATVRATRDEPQVVMPVSTLAMLLFGQVSAVEAWRMGRLDVHDHGALPGWDAVMRTAYRPFCADRF